MPLTNMCPCKFSLSRPCCMHTGKILFMHGGPWQAALNFFLPSSLSGTQTLYHFLPLIKMRKGSKRSTLNELISMSFRSCVIWSSGDTSWIGPLPTIIHNTVENFSSHVTDEPPTSKSRTGIYIYLNREGRWPWLPLTLYEDIRKFSLWVFVSLFLYDKKEKVSKADFSSWLYFERYLNKLKQRIKVYFI